MAFKKRPPKQLSFQKETTDIYRAQNEDGRLGEYDGDLEGNIEAKMERGFDGLPN